jgi:hypothetical protein
MAARRTLRDLYVVGKEVSIDDGRGAVQVWVQKLNPVDHRTAVGKADASRARVLSVRSDPSSDDYFTILNGVLDYTKEQLVNLLTAVEAARISPFKRSQISAEDEWRDEGYLEGLETTWEDEMSDRFISDPEDAEAARIHDELQRFISQVDEAISDDLDVFRDGLNSMSADELSALGVEYQMKTYADAAWIQEYYRWEIYFGCRFPERHKERYFEDIAEVRSLSAELLQRLSEEFRNLTVEPTEGKDLAVTPPSSPSSDPSEAEAPQASSGPPAA